MTLQNLINVLNESKVVTIEMDTGAKEVIQNAKFSVLAEMLCVRFNDAEKTLLMNHNKIVTISMM